MSLTTRPLKIWISGASSGIGFALTLRLLEQGHQIFASARNVSKLEVLVGKCPLLVPVSFDITDSDAIEGARNALQKQTDGLDKVILNAGNCEYIDIDKPDWGAFKRVIDVNFLGTVNTLDLVLPLLKAQSIKQEQLSDIDSKSSREKHINNPHIIGVSSMATMVPFSRAGAYGGSKAALNYLLDSFRLDLKRFGIDVTTVLPGFVKTPLTDKNNFSMPFLMSADEAARRILRGVASRPKQYVFPKRLYFLLKVAQFLPSIWDKVMISNEARSVARAAELRFESKAEANIEKKVKENLANITVDGDKNSNTKGGDS